MRAKRGVIIRSILWGEKGGEGRRRAGKKLNEKSGRAEREREQAKGSDGNEKNEREENKRMEGRRDWNPMVKRKGLRLLSLIATCIVSKQ